MRTRIVLGLALTAAVSGVGACTDGGSVRTEPSPAGPSRAEPSRVEPSPVESVPAVPRNSDGSLQILPPGPPSRPPYTLVLRYDDFGPPALAGRLLGPAWWQWEGGGSWEPGDAFDVRVVVYRGLARAEVEAEYRTVEGHADYRHVRYDDALAHLEEGLAEIEGEPSLRSLHEQLLATRARLRQALGTAAPAVEPRDRAGAAE